MIVFKVQRLVWIPKKGRESNARVLVVEDINEVLTQMVDISYIHKQNETRSSVLT